MLHKVHRLPSKSGSRQGPTWLQKSNRGPIPTWVLKTRPIWKKNTHHFFKPNYGKLQNDSKNVSHKIGSKRPRKLGPILVSESGLFFTLGSGTSRARNKNLRPLLNRNIPLTSGKYGLRNHFQSLESVFLMKKSENKGPNFWGPLLLILGLAILESFFNFRKIWLEKKSWVFFSIRRVFRTNVCNK